MPTAAVILVTKIRVARPFTNTLYNFKHKHNSSTVAKGKNSRKN